MICSLRLVLILMSLPLVGQDSELRFPIEGLRVQGAQRVSTALILAEAGLQEGETYTEQQITLARRRLMRLPHLLHAEMDLEKGSEYGTYVLVISVQEATGVFFRYAFTSREQSSGKRPLPAEGSDAQDNDGLFSVGSRGFWGPWWHWYATADIGQQDAEFKQEQGRPLDVGISHRNLFGLGLFFNLNLQHRGNIDGELFDPYLGRNMEYHSHRDLAPTLQLAQPFLGRNQWLALTVAYLFEGYQFDDSSMDVVDKVGEKRLRSQLAWYRDTTDDLALPRTGSRFEVGLSSIQVTSNFSIALNRPLSKPGEDRNAAIAEVYETLPTTTRELSAMIGSDEMPQVVGENSARGLDLNVDAAWYQPIGYVWSASVRAIYMERLSESGALIRDPELRVSRFAMSIDYDLSHLLPRRPLDDLRLALTTDFREQRDLFQTEEVTGVQLGLSWRLRWGISRMVFRYEDLQFATPRSKPKEPS